MQLPGSVNAPVSVLSTGSGNGSATSTTPAGTSVRHRQHHRRVAGLGHLPGSVNAPVSVLSSNSGNGSAGTSQLASTGTTGHTPDSSGSTGSTTAGSTLQAVTGGLGL